MTGHFQQLYLKDQNKNQYFSAENKDKNVHHLRTNHTTQYVTTGWIQVCNTAMWPNNDKY